MEDYLLEVAYTINTILWIILLLSISINKFSIFMSLLLLMILIFIWIISFFEHKIKQLYTKPHFLRKMSWTSYQKITVVLICIGTLVAILTFLYQIGFFNSIIYGDSGVIVSYGGNITYFGGTQGTWKIQINDWEKSLEDIQLKVIFPTTMINDYNPIPLPVRNYTEKDEYGNAILICEWNNLPKGGVITVDVVLNYISHDSDLCPVVELSAKDYGVIYTYYCNKY